MFPKKTGGTRRPPPKILFPAKASLARLFRGQTLKTFGDAIEVSDVTTPADWRRRGLEWGAPFPAAPPLRPTAPLRPGTLDHHHPAVPAPLGGGTHTHPSAFAARTIAST